MTDAGTDVDPETTVYGADIDYFVDSMAQEGDSMRVRSHKLMMLAGMPLCGLASLLIIGYWATVLSAGKCNAGCAAITAGLVLVSAAALFIILPTYLYVRLTQSSSVVVFDLYLVGWTIYCGAIQLAVPVFPCEFATTLILCMAVVAGTPRLPIHFILQSVLFWMSAARRIMQNDLLRGSSKLAQVGFPDPRSAAQGEAVIMYALAYVMVVLLLALVHHVLRTLEIAESDSSHARSVARIIIDRCACYDLGKASEALDNYISSATPSAFLNRENQSLAGSAKMLIMAMMKFKPHLPNWVVDSQEAHEDSLSETLGSLHEQRHASMRRGSDQLSRMPSGLDAASTESGGAEVAADPDGMTPRTPTSGRGALYLDRSPQTPTAAYTGRVSFVIMDFCVFQNRCQSRHHSVDAVLCNFVERTHAIANTLGASIHTFIGDSLVCSWNATRRRYNMEASASQFMSRIALDAADPQFMRVSGAAMTCDARCVVSGTKTQAQIVSLKHKPLLAVARRFALHHGICIVDAATYQTARSAVEFRAVDAITTVDNAGVTKGHHLLYVIASERNEVQQTGEWMYVVDRVRDSKTTENITVQMVDSAYTGDYPAALDAFNALPLDQRQSFLPKRFGERITAAQEHNLPPGQFHTTAEIARPLVLTTLMDRGWVM